MEGLCFYSPLWFALAPLVAAAVWLAWRPRRQAAAIFSSVAGLKGLPVTLAQRARRLLPPLYALGLVLLVAALARPQVGRSESRIHTEGIAIEMVVDISGTMQAEDFELEGKRESRLNAVKHVFKEFVLGSRGGGLKGRPNDLIGLVAFGGFADSKCPLTLDHGALADCVQALEVPKRLRDRRGNVINERLFLEETMTAIGDGLALALDRLRNVEAKSKVVILLTDGDNNAGVVQPPQAAEIGQKMGVKVYTIGIGRTGWAPIPIEDEFGHRYLERAQVRLDEDLLRGIAEKAGGQYFNATNTKALAEVYAAIDKMEKSKVEETRYTDYTELYLYFAVPGLALVVMVSFLEMTRFRGLP
ncbi:MAG: VWA domain-containing protein [Planctomycetota bacterium]|nr:VWA domain-containing protein [Planctomycetota bacterium]